ncbi:MAG TPA: PQQ-dependent sugar dehydrogenase [Steroidobacteraceae bacterium]|jgi:glucose/arabinose dehydrogenase
MIRRFTTTAICALCFGVTAADAQQAPGPASPAAAPARTFTASSKVEGQPNETRPPEKADDKPEFPGQTRAPYRASVPVQSVTITDKLALPWSVALLPDGRYLVTEKAGTLRIVDKDGALSDSFAGIPAVLVTGQGGLLDVALDPKFSSNKRIFFAFTQARAAGTSGLAVARATLDEQSKSLKDVKVIYAVQSDAPVSQSAQQGGRIALAKDGTLFVTIGDRSTRGPWLKAQDMTTALGKIIHITADGTPAPGNPFLHTPGVLPEIWSSGHRNQQGIAFDASGQLWEVEHGPQGGDELNSIHPGKNYGWPVIVHGIDYTGKPIGAGITAKAGLEQPQYYWDPVIAPSGLAFYSGKLIPQWNGSVLISALRGQQISRLTLHNGKVVAEEPLFSDANVRFRDVRVDREGAVIVLTENGKLLKITPK